MARINYSSQELCDMVLLYGETRGNAARAFNLYRDRYPNRRHPANGRVIVNAVQRVRDNQPITGGVQPAQGPGAAFNVRLALERRILQHFRQRPTTSTRRAGLVFGVQNSIVHKVLKKNKKHPYKFLKVQAMLQRDYLMRKVYCEWFMDQCHGDRRDITFAQNVIWTDESTFTNNGLWNPKNTHYWSTNNPRLMRQTAHQYRFSVNVWAAVHGNTIIGPVFIDGNLNTARFLDLINGTLLQYYNNLPEEIRNATWFQLDGAPAHSPVVIREKLSELFGNRWIGRFGPKRWPPRSPDLTCLDFFLWGALKNDVYSAEVDNVEMLKDRIIQAFNTIRQRDLNVVHQNTLLRYDACIQAHGQHIENIFN